MFRSPGRGARHAGGWLLQIVAGALLALLVVMLFAWRVAVCEDGWQASPITFLVVAALLLPAIAKFAAARLAITTFAFLLAGYASWLLYIGSALAGCD
jgi:hypothetical protein